MRIVILFLLIPLFNVIQAQEVSTLAGSGALGTTDGPAMEATFTNPHGIAMDALGNIYISDRYGHKIRKLSVDGVVTTLAGSGSAGDVDGTGANAAFNEPWAICMGADGNIYVADTKNNKIRQVTLQGEVTTYAGNGEFGVADGPAATATFGNPTGIAADASENIYVADHLTHIIRKITPDGTVSRLAGAPLCMGLVDGTGDGALFNRPYGLTVDGAGNVYVADEWNHAIRKITPSGVVSTIAGNGTSGYIDGIGDIARFKYPWDLDIDSEGNLYVMDGLNHVIRKLIPTGSTPPEYGALTYAGAAGQSGYANGYGNIARFKGAAGIHYNTLSDEFCIADTYNNRIRKVADFNEQSVLVNINNNSQGVVCNNEQFHGQAFPANFDTYIFFIDGQIVQSGGNENCMLNGLNSGSHTFSVHGINPSGTYISEETAFEVEPAETPQIEVNGQLPFPEGSAIVLSTADAPSCLWSSGETTPSITVEEPGTFTVDVLQDNGCVGTSDLINVQQFCRLEVPIIELEGGVSDVSCIIGEATLTTGFVGDDLQWLRDGSVIDGATSNSYTATENGAYQLVSTSYGQNVYSNVIVLNIVEPIILNFTANKTVVDISKPKVKFTPVLYDPDGNYSFLWNFGDPGSGANNISTAEKPNHSFSGVGVYTITLTVTNNITGCVETMIKFDMITVNPGFVGETDNRNVEHIIYVPNAFSPNGDGENDILFVRGEEITAVEFLVYNKKGKLVFESDDMQIGWDGNIGGLPAVNETYNYLVKAQMSNGDEEMRTGKVFVIR